MVSYKVIFHINEPEKWQVVFANSMNFINDIGKDNADIEIIANGNAVIVFKEGSQEILQKMSELADKDVNFAVCRNALKMHSIEPDSLPGFLTTVSAGITQIAKKQSEGYAYIKP